MRQAVREARRRAGLSQADADALAGLGIDVAEIIARVEEVHGVGAMSGDRKDKGWWSGRPSFGRGAKGVLEHSLRVALAQRDRHIGDEHILLALTMRPGVPAEVLADHGVTVQSPWCGCCTEVARPRPGDGAFPLAAYFFGVRSSAPMWAAAVDR
ncbi:hypothetical protein SPURM210S_03036 [Streptomyces purpurascens]